MELEDAVSLHKENCSAINHRWFHFGIFRETVPHESQIISTRLFGRPRAYFTTLSPGDMIDGTKGKVHYLVANYDGDVASLTSHNRCSFYIIPKKKSMYFQHEIGELFTYT